MDAIVNLSVEFTMNMREAVKLDGEALALGRYGD